MEWNRRKGELKKEGRKIKRTESQLLSRFQHPSGNSA